MNQAPDTGLRSSNNRRVLHSWKEISAYVGRGVRTIQRYEVDLRFPVHRLSASSRSAVLAFSDEIDQWLASSPTRQHGNSSVNCLEHCRGVHDKAKLSSDQASSLHTRIEETRALVEKLTAFVAKRQLRREQARSQGASTQA